MDTLTTEEQQLAAIKQWWKENGSSIVTGVVLGLAVLFGTRAWFAYQDRNAQSASNVFAVMMNALQSGDEQHRQHAQPAGQCEQQVVALARRPEPLEQQSSRHGARDERDDRPAGHVDAFHQRTSPVVVRNVFSTSAGMSSTVAFCDS